jgi:hypothetical protein
MEANHETEFKTLAKMTGFIYNEFNGKQVVAEDGAVLHPRAFHVDRDLP